MEKQTRHAFTLIELSLVLVIIGLLIGGVVGGTTLVESARIRRQISQVEQYQTAVNVFRIKYNALPGDCKNASQFGFPVRGNMPGEGDGNGVLESNPHNTWPSGAGHMSSSGETALFWVDLSKAGLIGDAFALAAYTGFPGTNPITATSTPALKEFYPQAAINSAFNMYVYSGASQGGGGWTQNGRNYFGLAFIEFIYNNGEMFAWPRLTVHQAHAIDGKIDDGLPQGGWITAKYLNSIVRWAGSSSDANATGGATTVATQGSPTSCYDNSASGSGTPGVTGAVQHYSTEMNQGRGMNCALSFEFK